MTKSKLIIFAENYVDGDIVLSRLRSNGKSFISIVDLMNTPSKRKSYPSIFCMVQLIDSKKPDDFLAEYFISYTYIYKSSAKNAMMANQKVLKQEYLLHVWQHQ